MKLYELEQQDLASGYYDASADKLGTKKQTDVRKSRVFLRNLNRIKKMRAIHKLENLKRQDLLGVMYAPEDPAAGGGMMSGGF